MERGMIFDIKKYSINDGPGIRTTVFLSGCPLKCLWCHNPESQSLQPVLMYRENHCLGCGECIVACPENAISLGKENQYTDLPDYTDEHGIFLEKSAQIREICAIRVQKVFTDRDKCTKCQTCVSTCYSGAREFSGREMTVGQVMAQVEREIPFYDESGGGVTFSGGEPLMQPGFLSALLKACRRQEIHTCVDTSGFANWQVFEQIRGEVDLFLYDLKHIDSEKHREVTGVPNDVILENLRKLAEHGHRIVVRVPLIPGINDDERNLVESAKFLASLPHLESVELMGYHDIAQAKYEALGREYKLLGLKGPAEVAMNNAANLLRSYGLNVVAR
jgi:pyruvate formate lyase activating enzyme